MTIWRSLPSVTESVFVRCSPELTTSSLVGMNSYRSRAAQRWTQSVRRAPPAPGGFVSISVVKAGTLRKSPNRVVLMAAEQQPQNRNDGIAPRAVGKTRVICLDGRCRTARSVLNSKDQMADAFDRQCSLP